MSDIAWNTYAPTSAANPTSTTPSSTHDGRRRFGRANDTTDPDPVPDLSDGVAGAGRRRVRTPPGPRRSGRTQRPGHQPQPPCAGRGPVHVTNAWISATANGAVEVTVTAGNEPGPSDDSYEIS